MSGGSGPIDKKCAKSLLRNSRELVLLDGCEEIEIFKNLSMNRVAYFPARGCLYYVASEHSFVRATIDAVFTGLKKSYRVEQLYLDKHQFFCGPLRLVVAEQDARALLVALRLNQVSVSIVR